MKYLKYEFTDTQLKSALAKITNEEGNYTENVLAVADLGKLVKTPAVLDEEGNEVMPAVYATKNSVDILWADQPLTTSFASYVVWPEPCGIHIFAGWEGVYTQEYCEIHPEYCNPPQPIEE